MLTRTVSARAPNAANTNRKTKTKYLFLTDLQLFALRNPMSEPMPNVNEFQHIPGSDLPFCKHKVVQEIRYQSLITMERATYS